MVLNCFKELQNMAFKTFNKNLFIIERHTGSWQLPPTSPPKNMMDTKNLYLELALNVARYKIYVRSGVSKALSCEDLKNRLGQWAKPHSSPQPLSGPVSNCRQAGHWKVDYSALLRQTGKSPQVSSPRRCLSDLLGLAAKD